MNQAAKDHLPPEEALVLVIDDEEAMRDSCASVLRREGFNVQLTAHGEEGLQLCLKRRPDIAFVDLNMPGTPGMAVLDELSARSPDTVKVVITAYATVSAAMTAMRHGAFDFLPKPFTPDELRIMASRALEHRRLVMRAQRLRQERDQAKRRFVELVSGEVGQPLEASLADLAKLAGQLGDRPEQAALARGVEERLRRLLDMVGRWQA